MYKWAFSLRRCRFSVPDGEIAEEMGLGDAVGPAHLQGADLLFPEQAVARLGADAQYLAHLLDGEDVSGEIRTDEISMLASTVSTKKTVRMHLVKIQQQIAKPLFRRIFPPVYIQYI